MLRKCPKCNKWFRKRSTWLKHYKKKHDEKSTLWSLKGK